MKKNSTIILGVTTAVVLILAIIAVQQESATVSDQQGGYVFPGLKDKVNSINELVVSQRDKSFSIKQKDNNWVVVDKQDYPADISKVKQTILKIAELTTVEPKTKKPDNYQKIGVEEPTEKRATSKLITLKDNSGAELASLIVGKQQAAGFSATASGSVYVRKAKDEQSWLAKGELPIDTKARDWLHTDLFSIDAKRVHKVSIGNGKSAVNIEKADLADKDYQLLNLPKKKQVSSPTQINAIAEGLSNIIIKDVQARDSDKAVAFEDDVVHAEFTTFDGLHVAVDTVKKSSRYWAKFSVKYDAALRKEPAAPATPAADAAPAADAKAPAADAKMKPHDPHAKPAPKLQDAATTEQEAAKLKAKLEPWIFEISSTKAENMRKKLADLVKDA